MKLTASIALLTIVCLILAPQCAIASLAQADKHFQQKSFAVALKEYEAAMKAGELPALRKDDAPYRIAVCLGKTQQWDRALSQSLAYVKTHRGTIWEPRGLYWLGRLYIAMPDTGYRVQKTLYRGRNVPKTTSSDKPQQVNLQEQDSHNALEALEAARVLYTQLRAPGTAAEQSQLDFDLAHLLTGDPRFGIWGQAQKWSSPENPEWRIDPTQPYSLNWATPKKILYLYAHIRSLASKSGAHTSALALLDQALWLRYYQQIMRGQYAIRYEKHGDEEKPILIPFPYQNLQPLDSLRQIVHDFPNDPIRDQAQYLLANLLHGEGRLAAAAQEYRRLIAQRPKSKWVSDSRLQIANITHRTITVNLPGSLPAGKPPVIPLTTTNMTILRFELYRIPLETWMGQAAFLQKPDAGMNSTPELLGSFKTLQKKLGKPIAEWKRPLIDKGDYLPQNTTVSLPIRQAGAYLFVTNASGIRTANIVTLTDMVLVQKVERDGALFYATDARTGHPIAGAHILAKQWFNEPDKKGNQVQRSFGLTGVTDQNGIVTLPFSRKAGRNGFRMAALASHDGDYALTQTISIGDYEDNQGRFKSYCTTDRSVYRPFQTVRFRDVVMERRQEGMKPVVGKQIHVQVYDAKNRRIFARLIPSSEFGSVNGQFDLTADAPLGEYRIDCSLYKVENAATEAGGNQFRVEEYKKPEYEVTVAPEAERVRLGQPTSAKVTAKYYFGGPVPNAKVTYKVYRNSYAQYYQFPQPFDFLYANSSQGAYDTDFRNGEVISQGTTRTDEKGEAKVTFPTQADGARWHDQDLSYTIEADVQDSSRRTITGTGSVKATRHDVAVFLNYPHGYALKGDRVDVEIVTLNSSDVPVGVEGVAKVFRQPKDPKGKETLERQEPLVTDSHGRAILKWTAGRAGYYRIAFVTHDTAGQDVEGSTWVWVQGPELTKGEFHNSGVFLAVQNPYYKEGDTAKLLIATQEPGCSVLLTREVNNQILDRQVIRISGSSTEVSIPLTHRDVPNVYISAAMVRNGELFQATQEIFVPPVSQLAKVSVQADKEKYQPGEKAKMHLTATDWQDRPLRTELAVSISDAALSYIQKDYAPDIRVYFYGDRRSQSIQSGGSPGTAFQELDEDTQPSKEYQTHEWVMPGGMGMLDDWPGRSQNVRIKTRVVDYEGGIGEVYAQHGRSFGGGRAVYAPMGMVAGGTSTPTVHRARVSSSFGGGRPGSGSDKYIYFDGDVSDLAKNNNPGHAVRRSVSPAKPAGPAGPSGLTEPTLRSHFSDTAFWTPAVVTDAQGNASVEVTWPDNLTQWKAQAIGNSSEAQVGTGETRVTTKKDLLVRLEAPRYFVERDTMTISAIVQNYTDDAAHVTVKLDMSGDTLEVVSKDQAVGSRERSQDSAAGTIHTVLPNVIGGEAKSQIEIVVPKDGEKRVDWIVHVMKEGEARIRMTAQSPSAADATEMTFPVLIHGVERAVTKTGVLRPNETKTEVTVSLPQARKPGSSELVVQVNSSLAAIMLDALPYLNDYPYGCIEQTMSRFLPSVLTARTLKEQGFQLEDLRKRMQALEKQTQAGRGNLDIAGNPYTYPNGKPGTESNTYGRWNDPVFDQKKLDKMVTTGLSRIRDYQHGDGGWGWWKDDSSDAYMTAYVIYGLLQARQAGYSFEADRLKRASDYLLKRFLEEDDLHRLAYEARVLALEADYRDAIHRTVSDRIYSGRERLSAYSKALLALALNSLGEKEKAAILIGNLENTVKVDEANGTANWGESDSYWWRWYNDQVETNATVLQAYLAIQPNAKIPPMLVKWLVNHRQGDQWSSTRETALAVYALSDYIRINKELSPDYTLTLDLGGKVKRTYKVSRENALLFDNRFVVPDELLQTGNQTLTITKHGTGTCYYGAYTRYFSQEDSIPASGNEIFVTRRYFRLLPGTASGAPEATPMDWYRPNPFLTGKYELLEEFGSPADNQDTNEGPHYERTALNEGDTVTSGDLLEVELQLESKNDYDYLAFEDLKPAGCEPVEVRSGGKAGEGVYSNMELRDQKVAFFISNLPQGRRSLSYRLRAEAPGQFHVLPTNGYAMYAPAVRTLSSEFRIAVKDE